MIDVVMIQQERVNKFSTVMRSTEGAIGSYNPKLVASLFRARLLLMEVPMVHIILTPQQGGREVMGYVMVELYFLRVSLFFLPYSNGEFRLITLFYYS